MARKMVHTDQGQTRRRRQSLRQHHARQHAADQPRTRCHRNRVQIGQRTARLRKRLFHHMIQLFHMRPRREFRHDPAKGRVQCGLAHNDT